MSSFAPAPLGRVPARGRPASDPGCAGCPQLGVLRALRRAGLDVQGASGCEPGPPPALAPASGRWAALTGADRVLASPDEVVGSAAAAGARVLVVLDRLSAGAGRVGALLARTGSRVVTLDPGDLAGAEAEARGAAERAGSALVALSPCPRGAPARPPLAIAAARCNRCGACLCLACPAIRDAGGESMEIDPAVCTGCGLCAPLCRGRAIAGPEPERYDARARGGAPQAHSARVPSWSAA